MRGLVGCVGTVGLMVAASRLPLAVTSLIGFLAPMKAAAGALLLLGEPISGAVALGSLVSFAGVALVLQPWAAFGGLGPLGVAISVGSQGARGGAQVSEPPGPRAGHDSCRPVAHQKSPEIAALPRPGPASALPRLELASRRY